MTALWGICGGSGSGKSTLAHALAERLGDQASILGLDCYYRDLGHLTFAQRCEVNFDHPDSLDIDLFTHHLDQLAQGAPIEVPEYDFSTHNRTASTTTLDATGPGHTVLIDGILLLGIPEVRDRLDMMVLLDVPADVRLERRVARDVADRGRIAEEVREVFASTVRPMEQLFLDPHHDLASVTFTHPFAIDEAVDQLLADHRP